MMSILHTHGRGGKSTAHVTTVDGDWSASGGWQFHFLRLARNFSMKMSLKLFHLNLNFKCQTVGERFDCYANDCNHVTCHLLTRRSTRNRFAAGHVWFWVAEIRQIPGGHSSEYLPVTQHWRVTPPCAVAASASARRRRQGDSSCRNARYHYLVAIECGESAANETFQPCDRQRHFWLALGLDLFHYLHNSKMLIRHFLKESKKLLSYLAPSPTGRTWCHLGGKESRDTPILSANSSVGKLVDFQEEICCGYPTACLSDWLFSLKLPIVQWKGFHSGFRSSAPLPALILLEFLRMWSARLLRLSAVPLFAFRKQMTAHFVTKGIQSRWFFESE